MADVEPLEVVPDDEPMKLGANGETPEPKRRGRPPGSTNRTTGSTRANANVAGALAVMDSAYSFINMGLMMVSRANAYRMGEAIPRLQESNRLYFQATPKLAERIAKVGSGGGSMMFLLTNVATLGPIIAAAIPDIQRLFTGEPTATNDDTES